MRDPAATDVYVVTSDAHERGAVVLLVTTDADKAYRCMRKYLVGHSHQDQA